MPISQRRAVIPAGAPYNADRWVMIAAIATSDRSDPYYKLLEIHAPTIAAIATTPP